MNPDDSESCPCTRVLLDALEAKHDALKAARAEHNTTAIALRLVELQVLRDVLGDLGYGEEALNDFLEEQG